MLVTVTTVLPEGFSFAATASTADHAALLVQALVNTHLGRTGDSAIACATLADWVELCWGSTPANPQPHVNYEGCGFLTTVLYH